MNFNKYCVPMLLLCVLLANKVKQTDSEDVTKETLLEALPLVAGFVGGVVAGPIGPILTLGVGLLQMTAKMLKSDDSSQDENLSKKDFLESQTKIADAVEKVNSHLSEAYDKLYQAIESLGIMEDMRNDMDTLRDAYAKNMKVILDRKTTAKTKQARMQALLDYYSSFRKTIRSFMSKYIQPKNVESPRVKVNLFFDFILGNERTEIDGGDDCHSESTHTKIFKSYISILKTLTDAYVMVVFAHTIQYRNALKKGNKEYAIETQNFGLELLNEYKIDMELFMKKAKWALDKASREIRNCGKFELKRGETFESISFAHILPKFKDWNFDRSRRYSMYDMPDYKCYAREQDVKYDDYEIAGKCSDLDLNKSTRLKVFINSTNSDWPYMYMETSPSWGADQVYGHIKKGPEVISREYLALTRCKSLFCPAFKKNAVAISTQIVRCKPENVITGVRFRVLQGVIYIDIQEGKPIDNFSVDPKTVTWTETPKSDDILYLSSKIRNIEIGAVELKDNQYLTKIQFKMINEDVGIMGLLVGGGNTSDWTTSDLTGSSYHKKSNELVLSGCDNPEQFGAGVKNKISKAPVPTEPSFVSFQQSDMKKDFGMTTIPFIDIREVSTNPPAPLSGVGIYHETVVGSGGYLALKLITPSLSGLIDYTVIKAIDTTVTAEVN